MGMSTCKGSRNAEGGYREVCRCYKRFRGERTRSGGIRERRCGRIKRAFQE
jgi:hypothetical protein